MKLYVVIRETKISETLRKIVEPGSMEVDETFVEALKSIWKPPKRRSLWSRRALATSVFKNTLRRREFASAPIPIPNRRRREHRATAAPRAASSSGSTRSGPSSEAGPPSAGGDDPDGPPPPHVRANAPRITTDDADLGGAYSHGAAPGLTVGDVVVAGVVTPPVKAAVQHGVHSSHNINKPKEINMFHKIRNLVAVALAMALTFFSSPATGHANEGGVPHARQTISTTTNPQPEATTMKSMLIKVMIAIFTSVDPLTKSFTKEDGRLVSTPGGHMVDGQVQRVEVEFPHGFAELLTQLAINQACGYGVPNVDEAHVTTREKAGPGDLPRIRENFKYPAGTAVLMLDYDPRPGTVPLSRQELVALLESVCPELASCALVVSDSASTHIMDAETGEELKGEGGKRVYVVVQNGQDIARAGQVLFDRLVLAGHGYIKVTKAGTMLERTHIDGSVWAPEHLDFAAGAHCGDGLVQLRLAPSVRDGGSLDTEAVLPPLTPEEEQRRAQIVAALKSAAQDEADAVRSAWVEGRIQDHVRRVGSPLSPEAAQRMRVQMHEAASSYRLPDDFVLHCKDGEVTVAELLADPEKWDGTTFADPLEPGYHAGERLAKFIVKPGRQPYIRSFAHGGVIYSFASTPPTPPPPASQAEMPPAPTELELVELFRSIPVDTPSDQLPAALKPVASRMRAANPVTASKIIKQAASHLGVGATALAKLVREIEKELEDEEEDEPEEDLCLKIARGVNAATNGELACIAPPSKPSIMPTFHRIQPEGHLLEVRPEELQDQFNAVAGRPLEPPEFTLVAWYLASAVLKFRGGQILQRGILCRNGFITFQPGNWFIPGRPNQPCVFFVPRTLIVDPALLPPLESLKTIHAWKRWGVNIVALIEAISRVLLTQQTGICYVFWGPGGEGKSTYIKYVVILVGDWNVLHAQIADFSGERRLRGISTLRGKLLAVFDDAPHNVFDVLGPFLKEACTGCTLTGAPLYQDAAAFPNTSLIVILSNHPSIGKDRTRGSFDRRNIHVWSHRIRYTAENQMDAELAWTQDEAEMDIIFSYAVHFARRYLETGAWQYQQPVEEAAYIAETLTTVEARFLWERFEQAEGHYVSWDDIDTAYNRWWTDVDHRPPFSHDRFFVAVEVTWGGELCRRQEDHHRTRGVTGIKLLPKQKPTFTRKPGLADVDLGVGNVVSGQKNPRIEGGPSSGEEKNREEEEDGNIFLETEEVYPADVGNSGHLDLREALREGVETAILGVEQLRDARAQVVSTARCEGRLHLRRAAQLLPGHLRHLLSDLVDDLVARGEVHFDGTWITAVTPDEVA